MIGVEIKPGCYAVHQVGDGWAGWQCAGIVGRGAQVRCTGSEIASV